MSVSERGSPVRWGRGLPEIAALDENETASVLEAFGSAEVEKALEAAGLRE